MSALAPVSTFPPEPSDTLREVTLRLTVTDPAVATALRRHREGEPRDAFALGALKIGVLAIENASGQIDAERVKREGERLLLELGHALGEHRRSVTDTLTRCFSDYFDPKSGRFTERVERLVKRDGELETVLRRQVGAQDSELARTLAASVGPDSPMLTLLDPESDTGFVAGLGEVVTRTLAEERERILREFSLDHAESALSRLVAELKAKHGEVRDEMERKLDEVVEEFSLDNDQSALSRLVGRVEQAQKKITDEFTLDTETSALARMRREITTQLQAHQESVQAFQRQVLAELKALTARRDEAAQSTRHGVAFEEALRGVLEQATAPTGDTLSHVGTQTGQIRNCKVGDFVLQLGPEHAAAGARIVIEAKAKEGVSLQSALAELEVARKNREAGVGVMVFAPGYVPADLGTLKRLGDDIVIAWDADDPSTDVVLNAALSLARGLSVRAKVARDEVTADLTGIDRAIRAVEKHAQSLDDIVKWANTVVSDGSKIRQKAERMKGDLISQVEVLDEQLQRLKDTLAVGQDE